MTLTVEPSGYRSLELFSVGNTQSEGFPKDGEDSLCHLPSSYPMEEVGPADSYPIDPRYAKFKTLPEWQQQEALRFGFSVLEVQANALETQEKALRGVAVNLESLWEQGQSLQTAVDSLGQSISELSAPGGPLDPERLQKQAENIEKQKEVTRKQEEWLRKYEEAEQASQERYNYIVHFEWLRDAAQLITDVASKALTYVPFSEQQIHSISRAITAAKEKIPNKWLALGVLFFLHVAVSVYQRSLRLNTMLLVPTAYLGAKLWMVTG